MRQTSQEIIPNEILRDIAGYEGLYQVSNFGRVKSLQRRAKTRRGDRVVKERFLSSNHLDAYSYPMAVLYKDTIPRTCKIHRLVAMAFIPVIEKKLMVNHKDCNKTNNKVENLEWCNDQENKAHAWSNGLMERAREKAKLLDKKGEKSGTAKLCSNDVIEIRRRYFCKELTQKSLGEIFKVTRTTIGKIVRRERWIHI